MGNQELTQTKKSISVISLNYSGILLSPFQFFSKQSKSMANIENDLSNIYKALLKKYKPTFNQNKKENKFKWNLGKIDQKMQKQRYSPLYHIDAGIVQFKNKEKQLMNEQEFKKRWELQFTRNAEEFQKKDPAFKFTQQQKSEAMDFDLLCYKTIICHVYNQDPKNIQHLKFEALNSQQYLAFMRKMFSKSFLNQEKKLEKTLKAMEEQNIDIVFAQEANERLVQQIQKSKKYKVFRKQGSQSIIILNKEKFHNFYNQKNQKTNRDRNPLPYLPELEKSLAWNNDTITVFVDNLILISGHLSSKKEKNPTQVYEMIESLKNLHAIYPMCHIIVGCDANSFAPDSYKQGQILKAKEKNIQLINFDYTVLPKDQWQIVPSDKNMFTTSKERTYLQPQINKAEEIARVCRDHLIILTGDDIKVGKTKVCTIMGKETEQVQNLPCQQHPYDHYVVKAELTINVVTQFQK